MIGKMGPNISSFMILLSLVILSKRVGSIYKSSLELLPPKQHYLYEFESSHSTD